MKAERLGELATPFFVILSQRAATPSEDPAHQTGPLDAAWNDFQRDALLLLGKPEVVADACYLLSTVCDEWMLQRFGLPWTRFSMLARHHGDARGGERCWETLEYLLAVYPDGLDASQCQLLELYLLTIGFGWRGRYRMLPDGEEQVHNLRLKLHELLYGNDTHGLQTQQLVELSTRHLDRRQRHVGSMVIGLVLLFMALAVWFVDISLQRQWSDLTANLATPPRAATTTQPSESRP